MELPHIGDHCAQPDCNQLDYLPIVCSLCSKKFCITHHSYEAHSCPERYKVDVRIPICPVCENPVSSKRGQPPDLAVNEHLENNCQSKSVKIYKNKCSVPRCKQKEMVPVKCDSCNLSFCLRHRHVTDHECKGPAPTRRELTLNGSIFKNWMSGGNSKSNSSSSDTRTSSNKNQVRDTQQPRSIPPSGANGIIHVSPSVRAANVSTFQGNLTEEEALEKAIASSVGDTELQSSTPDEDMARAIAASIEEQNRRTTRRGLSEKSSDCSLS